MAFSDIIAFLIVGIFWRNLKLFLFYLFEFVGVRVCGFAKKIVLHSVQSTSNAVVVEYYYYFVLERGGYFLAIEEQNLIFLFGMVGTRS